ncbi:MAG: serine/threonine-protein kinase, partial [Myxococcota bacterium]
MDRRGCLDDDALGAILSGDASEQLLAEARGHAADCDDCRGLLATFAKVMAHERRDADTVPGAHDRTVDASVPNVAPTRVGDTIGRFVVLEPIGRGGMGAVYAARDETLQRKVAVKLLHTSITGDAADGRARLLREARAMATVTHPNVVAVHEAGIHDGDVFVVMDLVEGMDLRAWCAETARPAAVVIATWLAAGEGLAAIHRQGLVHRDFKPANVLIGSDGQVRVTDFGLVGLTARTESVPELETLRDALGHDQTSTGTVLGTPRFMAPEQLGGRRVDAAADQFAFCVSLWIALAGEHPFGEGDMLDRSARMRDEDVSAPPPGAVSARVYAVLKRGLAAEPADRFADMPQLLDALRSASLVGKRRARIAGALLGVSAAVTVGVMIGGLTESERCGTPPGGDFAAVWDEDTKEALHAATVARPGGAEEWPRIEAHLDAYTTSWSEQRRDACLATQVRGEASEDLLDRRMACLSRRRGALAALVTLASDDAPLPGATTLELAHQLPDLGACADLHRLAAGDSPLADSHARRRRAELEERIEMAQMLHAAGRTGRARRAVVSLLPEVETAAWPAGRARVLQLQALLDEAESAETGIATWRTAYVAAIAAGSESALSAALDG